MKSLKSPFRWGIAAIAVLGLVLAACAGSTTNSSSSTASSAVQAAPADQQILNLRLNGEPKNLDPQKASFAAEVSVIRQLFSTLFTYDDNLQLTPDIAAEMPTIDNGGISKDGKTYTIKLKKDLKWSDGKALTADDVVYGLKREVDPRTASPNAANYAAIAGAKDFMTAFGTKAAPKTPSDADLATLRSAVGVSASDTSTVVINLNQANGSFLQQLAVWPSTPVRQDVIEAKGAAWTEGGNLIGNGPFTLKEWAHNDHITLTANTNWHRGQAKLNTVNIRIIDDDVTAYAAYLNGELDSTAVPLANRREALTAGTDLNKELVRRASLTTFALDFNSKDQPWDNSKVRQAFATALDRKAFVEGVLQGVGVTTTSWLPPGMPGYDASVGKQYDFDMVKAKSLLAEAGYPNGQGLPKITLLMRANDTNQLVAQFVQDQFKKNLGVDIALDMVDAPTYASRFTTGQYNMSFSSWTAAWPYPDNWLPGLFATGASNNVFQYSNAKVDDLLQRAAAELDRGKQLDLYMQAQKAMIDDAGVAPVYNGENFLATKAKVRDLSVTGIDGSIKGDMNLWRAWIARA